MIEEKIAKISKFHELKNDKEILKFDNKRDPFVTNFYDQSMQMNGFSVNKIFVNDF